MTNGLKYLYNIGICTNNIGGIFAILFLLLIFGCSKNNEIIHNTDMKCNKDNKKDNELIYDVDMNRSYNNVIIKCINSGNGVIYFIHTGDIMLELCEDGHYVVHYQINDVKKVFSNGGNINREPRYVKITDKNGELLFKNYDEEFKLKRSLSWD